MPSSTRERYSSPDRHRYGSPRRGRSNRSPAGRRSPQREYSNPTFETHRRGADYDGSRRRAPDDRQHGRYPGPPGSERPFTEAEFRKICNVTRAIVHQREQELASARPANDLATATGNRRGNVTAATDVLPLADALVDAKVTIAELRKENLLLMEKFDLLTAKYNKLKKPKKKKAPTTPPPIAISNTDTGASTPSASTSPAGASPYLAAAAAAAAAATTTPRGRTPSQPRTTRLPSPPALSDSEDTTKTWKASDLPSKLKRTLQGVPKPTKANINKALVSLYPSPTSLESAWKALFPVCKPYPTARRDALAALTNELQENFGRILQ
jgi:hypothetical protein